MQKVVIGLFLIVVVVLGVSLSLIRNKNVATSQVFTSTPVEKVTEEKIAKTVTTIVGDVSILRDGTANVVATGSGEVVFQKDKVQTGREGIATIDYGDGTVVRLGPETKIEVTKSQGTGNTLFQTVGSLYVRFKKLIGIRESFSVETPTTIATVRGTAFASVVDDFTHEAILSATEHSVLVQEKDEAGKVASGEGTLVKENEIVTKLQNQKLENVKEVKSEKVKQWLLFNKEADSEFMKNPPSLKFLQKSGGLMKPKNRRGLFNVYEKLASLSGKFGTFKIPSPTPFPTIVPLPVFQDMPGEGYHRGAVKTEKGDFRIACYGGNKSHLRVVTDAGNEDDCKNDCTVMSLGEYVSRNGGTAGMNGMYFCPADYASCADKKNSFDTLFFHSKAKKYLNNDNNVYSTVPFFATDGGGNPHFLSRSLEQPRDGGYESGIAGNPLMVQGGNVVVPDNLEYKQQIKSPKGAIVQKGDMLYLCVTEGASVPEAASIYKTLGADNALNVDGGGSAALYVNGAYMYGPGRNIPNAIVFVNR